MSEEYKPRPIPDPDGEYEQYLQNGGYFNYHAWVTYGKPKAGNEGGKWIGDTTQTLNSDPDIQYISYMENGGMLNYIAWLGQGKPKSGNEVDILGRRSINNGDTTQGSSEGDFTGGNQAIHPESEKHSWEEANGKPEACPTTGYYESTDAYDEKTKTVTHTETNKRKADTDR